MTVIAKLKRRPTGEMRDQYIEKIKEVLERGPASRNAICAEIALNPNTCSMYLSYMRKELRLIRTKGGGRTMFTTIEWELGEDPTLQPEGHAFRRTVKARQVGIQRDVLVAALFGPAANQVREVA